MTLVAILAIILAAAALWAVGCGGGGGAYSTPTTPSTTTTSTTGTTGTTGTTSADVTISIVGSAGNGAFSPNPAPATSGQTVMFKNSDSTVHRLVADNGTWDSGNVAPGSSSKTLTVTSASALTFHCTIHPTMVGSINGVTAPPIPTPDASGAYSYDY